MLPEGYVLPTGFIVFLLVWWGLPPVLLIVGLVLKKPGKPAQFGPPPTGKSIASAALTVLNKSLNFQTRATRSEFWWYFVVAFVLITAIFSIITTKNEIAAWVFLAIASVPGAAVGTRRLHDIGRSGWWQLFAISISGVLVLLVLWMLAAPRSDETAPADVFE